MSRVSYIHTWNYQEIAGRWQNAMTKAHKLDCESAAADCRFIIQSENEQEAVELAQKHMRDVHGQEYTEQELQNEHLQIV